MKTLIIIFLTSFTISTAVGQVESIRPQSSFLQTTALKVYCRMGSVFNEDILRCVPQEVTQTVQERVVEVVRNVFVPTASAQEAPSSNLEALIRRIVLELLPAPGTVVVQGQKGDKGDVGQSGIVASQGTNLQAFQNIPMPFWNGYGSGASTGGGTTIVNNVTNVVGSSSTSSLVSLQNAYDFGGAGLGKNIDVSVGGAVDIKVQDGPGLFNGLTITGNTNTAQGMIFGKSNFGSGQQAAFGFADDITNPAGGGGLFANYNFALNRFNYSLYTAGASAHGMAMGNPAVEPAGTTFENFTANPNVISLRVFGVGGMVQHVGNGDPEGVVTADSGSVYFRLNGTSSVDQLYVKTTDTVNTGWVALGAGGSATAWDLLGNAGTNPGTNFLGTTDAQDLAFRTNNATSGLISSDGLAVFFGLDAGAGASRINTNFFGQNAGNGAVNAESSNFFGTNAGNGATNASNSNFFGLSAGNLATDADGSNFIGFNAGSGSINARLSNFIGFNAGSAATDAVSSNFIGLNAGESATNADNAVFIGSRAGSSAVAANNSIFLGTNAGRFAVNARDTIFIGRNSGNNDTVDNTMVPGDASILIGNNTNTGGFSNSIALGAGVVNTAINQLYIRDAITNFNIAGVNYNFPTIQAASAGDVLSNDGTGTLSWTPASIGCTPGGLGNNNTCLGINSQQIQIGGNNNTSVGANSLASVVNGVQNTAFGSSALSGTTGSQNTAIGLSSLAQNTSGSRNIGVGQDAGINNQTGNDNLYIGYLTGAGITSGNANTIIGSNVNGLAPGLSNNIIIADGSGNRRINVNSVGNAGIGTITPTERLDVLGNIRLSGALMPNNLAGATGTLLMSQGAGLAPVWTATSSLGITVNNVWSTLGNAGADSNVNFLGTTDAQDLVFKTNSIENMRIGTTGTVSVLGLVDTVNAGAALTLRPKARVTAGTGGQALLQGGAAGPTGTGGIARLVGGNGGTTSGNGGNVNVLGGQATEGNGGSISFSPGNGASLASTARNGGNLTFQSGSSAFGGVAGRVSITAGQGQLSAGGITQIFGGQGAAGFVGGNTSIRGGQSADGNAGNTVVAGALGTGLTGKGGDLILGGGNVTSTGIQGNVIFATGLIDDATYTERMRLSQNGNFAIGTTTATERLDILGNIRFSGALMPNNLAGATGTVLISQGTGLAPLWGFPVVQIATVVNSIVAVSTVLTGTDDQFQGVNTTGGTRTITLPAAVNREGQMITIFKTASPNQIDVDRTGGDSINFAPSTYPIRKQTERVTFVSDGLNNWQTIAQDGDFVGTDGVTAGERGLVPTPGIGDLGKILSANGAWVATSSLFSISSSTIASNFGFIQNGNSFGTIATLGTNDNNALRFIVSATEAMRVATSGFVGIGNTSPLFLLHTGSSAITSGTTVARFENAGGTCDVTPNVAGGITCTSDQNLKKDIDSIDRIETLNKLLAVEIKSYRMNADTATSTKQIGFLAQQLETQFPGLVLTSVEGTKSVSYAGMTPILTQSIQALYKFMADIGVVVENGIAKVNEFVANRVHTKELCIGEVGNETCITKGQLDALLQGQTQNTQADNTSNTGTSSGAGSQGQGGGTGTTTAATISPTENQDDENTVPDTNEDIVISDTNTSPSAAEEIVPQP